MALDLRKNLLQYAEETAYSSKGHFKTADYTKISLKLYISIPIILSIVLIVYSDMPEELIRLLNTISMIFAFLAMSSPLVNNQDQAHKRIAEHMCLGNDYLEVHKEIRNLATEEVITKGHLDSIAAKLKILDSRSQNFQIGVVGRAWSKWRINKEMSLDWIYDKS